MASGKPTPGTTTPTGQATHRLSLPAGIDPDMLDTLSELTALLTRLRHTIASAPPSQSGPSRSRLSSSPPSQQPAISSQPAAAAPATGQTPSAAGAPASTSDPASSQATHLHQPLTLKELPAAADSIRHRLQRARDRITQELPDMTRTIAEQEAEMAALVDKIRRQRAELEKLKEFGAKAEMAAATAAAGSVPPTTSSDQGGGGEVDDGEGDNGGGDRMVTT